MDGWMDGSQMSRLSRLCGVSWKITKMSVFSLAEPCSGLLFVWGAQRVGAFEKDLFEAAGTHCSWLIPTCSPAAALPADSWGGGLQQMSLHRHTRRCDTERLDIGHWVDFWRKVTYLNSVSVPTQSGRWRLGSRTNQMIHRLQRAGFKTNCMKILTW